MPEFNPNEMDALFRDGADRYEFEYNPDAWALMEEKLDKKSKKRKVIFFLLGLGLILLSILSYAYFKTIENGLQESIARIPQSIILETDPTKLIDAEKEASESKIENTIVANVSQDLKDEYIVNDSYASSSHKGAQKSSDRENTFQLINKETVRIDLPNKTILNEKYNQSIDFALSNEESLSVHYLESSESNQNKSISIAQLSKRDLTLLDSDKLGLVSMDLESIQPSSTPEPLTTSNRFAATVFANPEWSSVGLFKASKMGWSVGIKLGHQFEDKFEISAGFALSRKIYKGAGEAYTMEGGWFNDIEPMRMDAKCDVIEIPIGLTYYTNGFRNSGFFIDLGINSYMLHSEWYGFDYDDALVRPERYLEVIEEDQNSHFVGVGRFAIGYQKVLSNYTSLQVAPYLQFPLTGIGAGRVNLYSSGIQIAVKFNSQ